MTLAMNDLCMIPMANKEIIIYIDDSFSSNNFGCFCRVEKEVPAPTAGRGRGGVLAGRGRGRGGGGGLAALVGQLGKKNKLSTLEKSKLDWDRFKKHEGIEEDIQTHNKGKEG